MEFSNWSNRSSEGLLEFVNTWFAPPGSDIMGWTPPDWQEMCIIMIIKN